MSLTTPPLSLYIHMPWCVKKCPYCDFNSHAIRDETPPYAHYSELLLADLDADLRDLGAIITGQKENPRQLVSIFFGGGTPSLFAPSLIARLIDALRQRLPLANDAEITLETNPGTVEHGRFDGYLRAGINRLSFGIQSFDDDKLQHLGRIHSAREAEYAVKSAQDAGYLNINLDLMYGLPEQDLAAACKDVEHAMDLSPTHISHYQLSLEPHTAFAANPPPLPDDDLILAMNASCQTRLLSAGYQHYEISAYAKAGRRSVHNLNYWRFGDYLGIGAGAHGKLTDGANGRILRRWKIRHPRAWQLAARGPGRIGGKQLVPRTELPFEYMLNALRLVDGVPLSDFSARTGLSLEHIATPLAQARCHGWLASDPQQLRATALGQRFLNDLISCFLP